MKKKAIIKPEVLPATTNNESTDIETVKKPTQPQEDNNEIISSILFYMSEIKRHRENLQKEGIL